MVTTQLDLGFPLAAPVDECSWLLATGSREFVDRELVRSTLLALTRKHGPARWGVTHGAARGADQLVDDEARRLGWEVDPVPCTREEWERFGPAAGHRRNARMVTRHRYAGCVAFPRGLSAGTRGCVVMAEDAGIPVWHRGDPAIPDGWYRVGRGQDAPRFWVVRGVVTWSPKGSRKHHPGWWAAAADPADESVVRVA